MTNPSSAPDYIVLGYMCLDLLPAHDQADTQPPTADIRALLEKRGYALGGTVVYSALTARALDVQAGIVTATPRFALERFATELEGIRIAAHSEGDAVTVFENIYGPHGRQQYLRSRAPIITPADIPGNWREAASIIHLGPLAQEIGPEVAAVFSNARLVGVTPQGWLRKWDEANRVSPMVWGQASAKATLKQADVLVLSEEDIGGDTSLLFMYRSLVRIVVLTHGPRGCTVFDARADQPFRVPAFAVEEIEPTGAGDVFATAFFIRMAETDDPLLAAQFANATASFAVQAPGIAGIPPSRAAVMERVAHIAALQSA